jgi:4-hydroxy-2-oxoheptanedioate aldolase
MRANHVKRRLSEGEASIGTWMALPSPEAAEYVAGIGFDWLVVDAEHNPVDIRTLASMFRAMTASPVAPMVRIPWNDPEHFKRVLDAGAWGIVVPMVNSREEAERAVEATRYPTTGKRSVGGGRHALSFATTAKEYYAGAEDNILLVLQIEHIDGVEAADDILSVPGVDACFIGPNDLGASMGMGLGVSLESDDPGIVDAIKHIRETSAKHGVAPGIHCSDADAVNRRIGEGFQFCAMASELKYLLGGLNDDLKRINWQAAGPHEVETAETGEGTVVRY